MAQGRFSRWNPGEDMGMSDPTWGGGKLGATATNSIMNVVRDTAPKLAEIRRGSKDAFNNLISPGTRDLRKDIRSLGIDSSKHFHSFRHSYAIRRITMLNGNVFDVMREMGHTNTQTTMQYLRFPEQRRLDDFPSLKQYIENRQNMQKDGSMVTKSMVTEYSNIPKLPDSKGN